MEKTVKSESLFGTWTQLNRHGAPLLHWSNGSCLLIFLCVLLIYLSLPTANYYWDGIGYAYSIEHVQNSDLLHPNHLLYGPLGYAAWQTAQVLAPEARALRTLQTLSALFGAAAVAIFYLILISLFKSVYVATCLAFTLAFSGTWWKFATDADSYIPATFFLLLALLLASAETRPRPVWVGCAHAAAMLLHELAALFAPALLLALWYQAQQQDGGRRLLILRRYMVTASLITLVTYYAAYVREFNTYSLAGLLHWVTSYSSDVSFSFKFVANIVTSVVGHIKLFWGGRFSLVRSVWSPFLALTSLGFVISTVLTLWQERFLFWPAPAKEHRNTALVSIVWIGVYCTFLIFWLPHNTFYRLFYVPGVLLLVGTIVSASHERHYRLAPAVAMLFFWNLGFNIYPYAQPQFNGALMIAQELHRTWAPGTVVYWDVYASDNGTIQYFNPQVEWKPVGKRVTIDQLEDAMRAANANGKSVWFDLPALKRSAQTDPQVQAWLASNSVFASKREFRNGDHELGFVRVSPKGPDNAATAIENNQSLGGDQFQNLKNK
jgi:hypothetical protein